MKITHLEKTAQPTPILQNLKIGAVFRPINASTLYLVCDMDGHHSLLANSCIDLWDNFFDVQNNFNCSIAEFEDDHEYDELYVCVQLNNGKVVLLWEGIKVEEQDCELVVKERG